MNIMTTLKMKTLFTVCMLAGLLSLPSYAQVTIGSSIDPEAGALLDLKEKTPADPSTDNATATKGLMLPRVILTEPDMLYPMFIPGYDAAAEDARHAGLTVYNLGQCDGKFARGVYTWTGAQWVQLTKNPVLTGGDPDPTTVSPSVATAVTAVTGTNFTLGPVSVGFLSGSPATAYRWYRSADNGSNYTLMPDKTSNTLTTQEPVPGTYKYYCEMTNADCTSTSVQTGVYTVKPPLAGTGIFTGKTCFDIASGNFGGDCGAQPARQSQKTDFSLTTEQAPFSGSNPPYTGTQVYVFTPSGNVSNVRFVYLDASGQAIESMTPMYDYSGDILSGSLCKAVVVYKASLNTSLQGKTRDEAVKPELYVIYNDASGGTGTDRSIKLTVSLQDCACCGAATTSGGWLTFMCHNLGADEFLDPFTYVSNGDAGGNDIKGDLYQWGRPKDGHQLRNSTITTTLAATNTPNHANFITTNNNSPWDWRLDGGNDTRWGDGTQNEVMPKAANDPCPPGWKVPTQKQWGSIFRGGIIGGAPGTATANTWTWTASGYKIGSSLFLPAAGYRLRSDGTLSYIGSDGYYWSSTVDGLVAYSLTFGSSGVYPANNSYSRSNGLSVRCVSE
jgi:uncharacterized protein (TIGR02145 family)